MFHYRAAHPDVLVPRTKEPTCFARDLDEGTRADERYFIRDLDDYLALLPTGGASGGWRRIRLVPVLQGRRPHAYLSCGVALDIGERGLG
jgi:hypothetical protein